MKSFALGMAMLSAVFLVGFSSSTQETINKVELSGVVVDSASGELLPTVNVWIEELQIGKATDIDGKFSIMIPAGTYTLKASLIGYENWEEQITVPEEGVTGFKIELKPSLMMLEEVVVTGMESQSVTQRLSSKIRGVFSRSQAERQASPMYLPLHPMEMNSEEYDEISENTFHMATETPLSTFSIDVDGASYANIRRMITDGYLPPSDAVRIEEMINYFDYNYPAPTGDIPFSVNTEVAIAPWNTNHQLVQIGIQGEQIEADNLPPSNLVFLLDVSGSMSSPDKLPLLKKGFRLLVDQLREEDYVSIVVYAGSSGLVLPPTSGFERDKILAALDKLQSGGSTAGAAGIKQAYDVAKQNFRKDANNRVILATDGDFNVGVSSDDKLVELIEDRRDDGIFLSVLGFGSGNLKDSKMEKIANHGNGNYYYIDNLLEAKKVLVSEMGGTLHTIAKDVKIQVEFNPANVQAYRLIGYENRLLADRDFNDDTKDAGELGAGHTVTALYEIVPTSVDMDNDLYGIDPLKYQKNEPSDVSYSDEIMTVKLRYKEPDGDTSKLISEIIRTDDVHAEMSENLAFASAVTSFGMILRDSKYKGDSSYQMVHDLAKQGIGADNQGYRAEFIRLADLAELLHQGKSQRH